MLFKPLGTPHDSNRKRDMENDGASACLSCQTYDQNECVVLKNIST